MLWEAQKIMNANRNEQLRRAVQMVAEAAAIVELACGREENTLDLRPNHPRPGRAAEAAAPAADSLSQAIEKLEEAMERIQSAIGQ